MPYFERGLVGEVVVEDVLGGMALLKMSTARFFRDQAPLQGTKTLKRSLTVHWKEIYSHYSQGHQGSCLRKSRVSFV